MEREKEEREKIIFLNQKIEEIEECKEENGFCLKSVKNFQQNKPEINSNKSNADADKFTKKIIDINKSPVKETKNNNSFEIGTENEKKNICCNQFNEQCQIF